MLGEKDILLVAGKGHEQGQTIGREVIPFDDIEEVIMGCVLQAGIGQARQGKLDLMLVYPNLFLLLQ